MLLIPSLKETLISISCLLSQIGGSLNRDQWSIIHTSDDGLECLMAKFTNRGLYRVIALPPAVLATPPTILSLSTSNQLTRERIDLLHRCMGHTGKPRMLQALANSRFGTLRPGDVRLMSDCAACALGKSIASPHHRSQSKSTTFGEVLICDNTVLYDCVRGARYDYMRGSL